MVPDPAHSFYVDPSTVPTTFADPKPVVQNASLTDSLVVYDLSIAIVNAGANATFSFQLVLVDHITQAVEQELTFYFGAGINTILPYPNNPVIKVGPNQDLALRGVSTWDLSGYWAFKGNYSLRTL